MRCKNALRSPHLTRTALVSRVAACRIRYIVAVAILAVLDTLVVLVMLAADATFVAIATLATLVATRLLL